MLDNTREYVASTTLREPLPRVNSALLGGDVVQAVSDLREQPGNDIVVLDSGELIRSLLPHNLIDELTLLIHPLILGTGQRLYPDGEQPVNLQLVNSVPTSTGVIIATYRLAAGGD